MAKAALSSVRELMRADHPAHTMVRSNQRTGACCWRYICTTKAAIPHSDPFPKRFRGRREEMQNHRRCRWLRVHKTVLTDSRTSADTDANVIGVGEDSLENAGEALIGGLHPCRFSG